MSPSAPDSPSSLTTTETHLKYWEHHYSLFPVAAIYTVLRVLSGKITKATTEQLVVSIEHQPKWNRDQHEVHFTKPIFRPQLCAWWQNYSNSWRHTWPPSCSWLLLPTPTPPPDLCKLNWSRNLLSRCYIWKINTLSLPLSSCNTKDPEEIFRYIRGRGTSGYVPLLCQGDSQVNGRRSLLSYIRWLWQLQVEFSICCIESYFLGHVMKYPPRGTCP